MVKNFKIATYIIGIISLIFLGFGYYIENNAILFSGVFLVIFSVFFYVFSQTYELYQKEKQIDYELVKKLNLTIVECKDCGKDNVLEDKYCKYCGEEL